MKEFVKRIIKFTLCLAVVFMTLSIGLATTSPSSQVYAADGDVEINETTFPDTNFRQWVIDNIAGGSTTLTKEMIENTTEISINGMAVGINISSLSGIEYFSNLEILYCPYLQLSSLDVSMNFKLKQLNCFDNQLTQLDVSSNLELTNLYCYNNNIKNLDLSKNTKLLRLDYEYNQLTCINLSNNISTELSNVGFVFEQNPIFIAKHIGNKYIVNLKQNDTNLDTSKISDLLSDGVYNSTDATVTYDSLPSAEDTITYSYNTQVPNESFLLKNMLVVGKIIIIEIHSVYYDANKSESGSAPNDTNSYITDEDATVLDNNGNLTRKGYKFVGWNTSADGNGTSYKAGDIIKMGDSDITLYAQWTVAIPNTGVENGTLLYTTLFIIALVGISGMVIYTKRKN